MLPNIGPATIDTGLHTTKTMQIVIENVTKDRTTCIFDNSKNLNCFESIVVGIVEKGTISYFPNHISTHEPPVARM